MKLKLIYARAANGVIGLNNQMPWHLPEDLAHFKRTTLGCPVLMGRKTWESIPTQFRPLPGRANLVITRQADWQADGAWVVHSLEEGLSLALAHCPEGKDLWVMGGAEIYAQAVDIAEEAQKLTRHTKAMPMHPRSIRRGTKCHAKRMSQRLA